MLRQKVVDEPSHIHSETKNRSRAAQIITKNEVRIESSSTFHQILKSRMFQLKGPTLDFFRIRIIKGLSVTIKAMLTKEPHLSNLTFLFTTYSP